MSKDTLLIREVAINDKEACCAVEAACFPPKEAASPERIEIRIKEFPQGFLVAELDGEVVGQCNSGATNKSDITDEEFKALATHVEDGKNIVIFSLSVHPEHQRKGIAGALLQGFIQKSREQKRESVLLLCKDDLIGFYERYGFRNMGASMCEHGGAQWYEMALSL